MSSNEEPEAGVCDRVAKSGVSGLEKVMGVKLVSGTSSPELRVSISDRSSIGSEGGRGVEGRVEA